LAAYRIAKVEHRKQAQEPTRQEGTILRTQGIQRYEWLDWIAHGKKQRLSPLEVRLSQTIAEEKDCGTHVGPTGDPSSFWAQSAQGLGMADKPQKGSL